MAGAPARVVTCATADDVRAALHTAAEPNAARLLELRKAYDPAGVFRATPMPEATDA